MGFLLEANAIQTTLLGNLSGLCCSVGVAGLLLLDYFLSDSISFCLPTDVCFRGNRMTPVEQKVCQTPRMVHLGVSSMKFEPTKARGRKGQPDALQLHTQSHFDIWALLKMGLVAAVSCCLPIGFPQGATSTRLPYSERPAWHIEERRG